jgi:predicted nucleic acid-binding protein
MKPTPVASSAFVDSNVLLYTLGPDSRKAELANRLLDESPTISVQVLNEFVNVALKKLKLDWAAIETALAHARAYCPVVPVGLSVHLRAMELARENLLNIYDANIIAAAELAGCDVLYTEDMNHGQRIGRVGIVNPFAAA